MPADGPKAMLRKMTEADLDRVLDIERACFPIPWSRETFLSELNNLCARYVVLSEEGATAGFGGMWLVIDEAHVNNIAVHPDHRRKGYGRRILKELMRSAYDAAGIVQMTLEVRVTNVPAIELYSAMGFGIAGRRKNYYEDNGEDAYIMWCRNTLENLVASSK